MPNITSSERDALPNYWLFSNRNTGSDGIALDDVLTYFVSNAGRNMLHQLNATKGKAGGP